MAISDQIQRTVQTLTIAVQADVLDFVQYLASKNARREERDWSELSLAWAMRGMEQEDVPGYIMEDLRTVFG